MHAAVAVGRDGVDTLGARTSLATEAARRPALSRTDAALAAGQRDDFPESVDGPVRRQTAVLRALAAALVLRPVVREAVRLPATVLHGAAGTTSPFRTLAQRAGVGPEALARPVARLAVQARRLRFARKHHRVFRVFLRGVGGEDDSHDDEGAQAQRPRRECRLRSGHDERQINRRNYR